MQNHAQCRGLNATLLSIHRFTSPAKAVRSRRADERAELIVITGGVYRAFHSRRSGCEPLVEARVGDVVYWPEGGERDEVNDPADPTRCVSVYFRWADPMPGLPSLVHDNQQLIRMLADTLLTLKDVTPPCPSEIRNGYLAAMLAEYARLSRLLAGHIEREVARYAEEHMSERIRVGDLARHFGLEKHHFGRKYKAQTGRTPMADVRRIKAEHVRGMLATDTRLHLKEIAPRIGVRDEHQVSRLIKRCIGEPVRELRK